MESFKGIDLFDSFVTSWSIKEGNLLFELEVSIWPESKYYSKPKEKEFTCYKIGLLTFSGFSKIKGLKRKRDVKPTKDPDGSIDYGNIERFSRTDSELEIYGEFGQVIISGGDFTFEVYA